MKPCALIVVLALAGCPGKVVGEPCDKTDDCGEGLVCVSGQCGGATVDTASCDGPDNDSDPGHSVFVLSASGAVAVPPGETASLFTDDAAFVDVGCATWTVVDGGCQNSTDTGTGITWSGTQSETQDVGASKDYVVTVQSGGDTLASKTVTCGP